MVGDVRAPRIRPPRRCRHCRARSRAWPAAGWPKWPRPARARGRRNRSAGRSCGEPRKSSGKSAINWPRCSRALMYHRMRCRTKPGMIVAEPASAARPTRGEPICRSSRCPSSAPPSSGRWRAPTAMCACAGEISGLPRRAFLGPLLLRAEGRQGQDRGRDLAHHRAGPQVQAGRRAGGDRHGAHHHLSRRRPSIRSSSMRWSRPASAR